MRKKWGPEGSRNIPCNGLALGMGVGGLGLGRSLLPLPSPATVTHTFKDPDPAVPHTHPHLFLELCAGALEIRSKTRRILLSAAPRPGLEKSALPRASIVSEFKAERHRAPLWLRDGHPPARSCPQRVPQPLARRHLRTLLCTWPARHPSSAGGPRG